MLFGLLYFSAITIRFSQNPPWSTEEEEGEEGESYEEEVETYEEDEEGEGCEEDEGGEDEDYAAWKGGSVARISGGLPPPRTQPPALLAGLRPPKPLERLSPPVSSRGARFLHEALDGLIR